MSKPFTSKLPQTGQDKRQFNYSTLITKKSHLKISFEFMDQSECYVNSHSILKIFTFLNHSALSLEQICIKYITGAIANEDTSDFDHSIELAPVYVQLLNSSRSFYCNANAGNPAVMITDFSLRKSMSLLGETIVGMSDYISIAIFVFSEDELHNRFKNLTKLSLRANILEKYGHSSTQYPVLDGRLNVPIVLPLAEQNPRVGIADLDLLLENVESLIEDKPQKNKVKFRASSRKSERNRLIEKPIRYVKTSKSRPKYLGNKNLMSPFISLSGDSRQNSKELIIGDNNNFDSVSFTDDDFKVLSRPKGAPRLRAIPKPKVNGTTPDADTVSKELPKGYYAVYDVELERRLIPEKYIEITMNGLDKLLVKTDNITLYDNKKKIARLSSKELITKSKALDDIWVEVRDINDSIVFVKKGALDKKLKVNPQQELIRIDDFEGNIVVLRNTKDLLSHANDNQTPTPQSNDTSGNSSSNKKLFLVRLARIEINETSKSLR